MVRYRFGEFLLCPRRRLLVREGREVPLIPRYFDLLLLLIERRREAVHRREIFDHVWTDTLVSDSALSQAVRTIRRTLGDDSREPRFIRTVSRHGYRFVFPDVIEEDADDAAAPAVASIEAGTVAGAWTAAADGVSEAAHAASVAPAELAPPLGRAGRLPASVAGAEADAGADAGAADADADDADADDDLREAREPWQTAARLVAGRWTGAAAGGALAGLTAGGLGGLVLAAAPGSAAPIAIAPVLAVIGAACGAIGGAGVGAGLALAEAVARSGRALALTAAGALGGGLVGAAVQWLTRWALATLVGLHLDVGGGLEGIVIGAGAGGGFAIATRGTVDGLAAPRGGRRLRAALITAAGCGLAGLALTRAGHPLAGGTIHAIAHAAHGSRATLAPLGRLIGEPDFGPISSAILAFGEGAMFGLGLGYGLMRRPRVDRDAA